MASKSEIESKLAQNESQRNALAAKLGPAQDTAQRAYDAWQSTLRLRDQNVSESFTASFNGRTFSGPSAVEDYIAAAQTDFESKRDIRKTLAVEFNALFPEKEKLEQQLAAIGDNQSTVKNPEATNDSQSDGTTAEKYANTTAVPDATTQTFDDGCSIQTFDDGSTLVTDSQGKVFADPANEETTRTTRSGIPAGAERNQTVKRAPAEWAESRDMRVMLRTPKSYLKGPAAGPSGILNDFGGILFPYTPTISYDTQAVYGSVNPVHSNYTQYFYKNSQISQISISGKFTVQNEREGKIYLGIIHLLRSLTKMRWGADSDAGSPPPVCRLEAYGDYMLRNVPVVVANFKFDLPDTVDYISVKGEYKNTLVPTISTINLGLNIMYSRREMQDYTVTKWIAGDLRGQGYL